MGRVTAWWDGYREIAIGPKGTSRALFIYDIFHLS